MGAYREARETFLSERVLRMLQTCDFFPSLRVVKVKIKQSSSFQMGFAAVKTGWRTWLHQPGVSSERPAGVQTHLKLISVSFQPFNFSSFLESLHFTVSISCISTSFFRLTARREWSDCCEAERFGGACRGLLNHVIIILWSFSLSIHLTGVLDYRQIDRLMGSVNTGLTNWTSRRPLG